MGKKPCVVSAKLSDLKGEDYKIMSYVIYEGEFGDQISPFGRYLNLDVNDVINISEHTMKEIADKQAVNGMVTAFDHEYGMENYLFFFEGQKVDIDAAIDCGFGVMEITTGESKGTQFMFDHVSCEYSEEEWYEEDFLNRLCMYLLVTYPTYDNPEFEQYINTADGYMMFRLAIATSDGWLESRVWEVLGEKKRGELVEFHLD
ncbi:hypothetical protein [Radiobacillus sp. PE A8.2]|uniref:hypothetical protein n=1 Tax=Radiobacillus sp. PE A8.2 TaxID=3380349 RepID=UPI00388E73A8